MKSHTRQCGGTGRHRRSPHGERGLKFHGAGAVLVKQESLPSRGAWIEIAGMTGWRPLITSRSPHGERGLKWTRFESKRLTKRRSPHGERGLKFRCSGRVRAEKGRSPHGERGLKLAEFERDLVKERSLPSRGAWIEIVCRSGSESKSDGSLPSRGAWIEIPQAVRPPKSQRCRSPHGERGLKFHRDLGLGHRISSLPSRGAWIEIGPAQCRSGGGGEVAPLTGSVD